MRSRHHFIEKFLDQSTIMPHILHIPFLGQFFSLCRDLRHEVRQSLLQFCFFHMARQHELEAAIRGRGVLYLLHRSWLLYLIDSHFHTPTSFLRNAFIV